MKIRTLLAAMPAPIIPSSSAGPWKDPAELTGKDDTGETVFKALPVDGRFRNPWPADCEREFQQRARAIIPAQLEVKANPGNTFFENEKRSYGYQAASRPEYLETQYFGHSYQMGSLTGGTSVDGGDLNGFKILMEDSGEAFGCAVDNEGHVEFANGKPDQIRPGYVLGTH